MELERGSLIIKPNGTIEFKASMHGNVLVDWIQHNLDGNAYRILSIDLFKESEHEQVSPRNVNVGDGSMNGDKIKSD